MFRITGRAVLLCLVLHAFACGERDDLPPAPSADGGTEQLPDAGPGIPPPMIRFIDPDFGPVEGGTFVTIIGSGFQDGATVALGGLNMDDVQIIDDTTIEATAPAALQFGTADLLVANPDGRVARLVDAFYYEAPPPLPIAACALVSPARMVAGVNQNVDLRGRVFVAEHTPGAGAAAGIKAQAGYGFSGTDPAGWTWLPASYAGDADGPLTGDRAQDEYRADLSTPLPGTYRAAFRFSGDSGRTWSYCDRDGLANGFEQAQATELVVRTRVVGFCQLEGPARVTLAPGAPSAALRGLVYVDGLTDAVGPGEGVRAQVGYGPVGQSVADLSWTWSDAHYSGDAAGSSGTALANDRYAGSVTAFDSGTYDLAYRFSLDDGATWTYCDLDGSQNGYSSAQAGTLVVATAQSIVDACRTLGPAQVDVLPGATSVPVRGEVYVQGVTTGAGRGPGVRAQVGFGPVTAAPGGPSWSFLEAAYEGDSSGAGTLSNDVYTGTLVAGIPGSYAVAYRFSRDDGQTWAYCDLDGTDNGFELAQTARLNVSPVGVGYCQLSGPSAAQGVVGEPATYLGRVFVAGRTPGAGAGAGVRGQLGYGAAAAAPGTWSWTDASYRRDVDGLSSGDLADDEYTGTVRPAATGSYRVGYRFSVDGGLTWTLCDLTGSLDGFAVADAATLTVEPLQVGYCELTAPLGVSVDLGSTTGAITGRAFVLGRTPGAGRGTDVVAELGYGPPDDAPGSASWRWRAASYGRDVDGLTSGDLANDEYSASLDATVLGIFALAYRVSVDAGQTWTYCDADGSQNGYSAAAAGSLIVSEPGPFFGACRLETPGPFVALVGAQSPELIGSVDVPGVTDGPGAGAGILGAVGYGPVATSPQTSTAWVWSTASYLRDSEPRPGDLVEEYAARFTVPAAGSYDVAARFSVNGGVTWHVCDADGSDNGYEPGQAGRLIARTPIASCMLQFPGSTSMVSGTSSELVYGRVTVPGITSGAGQGASVTAELGYGPVGDAPTALSWVWGVAAFNAGGDGGAFDEYRARLQLSAATQTSYDYTYRFSTDGGQTHCYAQLGGGGVGRVTVQPVTLADARIQAPTLSYAVAGFSTERIYGQVSVPGYTSEAGQAAGVVAELGLGPTGTAPATTPLAWSFQAATYNPFGPPGTYDEYSAVFTAPAAGDYDLAARFQLTGGTFVYGDLDGSAQNGYQLFTAKRLVVRAPAGGAVDYCVLQFPDYLQISMGPDGAVSPTVYGRVYKAGVTPGDGWGAGLIGQLGFGPRADAPATWTWVTAGYRRDADGLSAGDRANDEYEAVFVVPPAQVALDLVYRYRFSANGGVSWTYCGLGPTGSGAGSLPGELHILP